MKIFLYLEHFQKSIFFPNDCAEIFKIVELTSKLKQPSYIRLTGGVNFPIVYDEDYEIEYGKFNSVFSSGDDVHIYATGSMVYHSREAGRLLKKMVFPAKFTMFIQFNLSIQIHLKRIV